MAERPRYELEDDLDTAEALLRDLPVQIERVRAQVREARARLAASDSSEGLEASEDGSL